MATLAAVSLAKWRKALAAAGLLGWRAKVRHAAALTWSLSACEAVVACANGICPTQTLALKATVVSSGESAACSQWLNHGVGEGERCCCHASAEINPRAQSWALASRVGHIKVNRSCESCCMASNAQTNASPGPFQRFRLPKDRK